MNTPITLTTLPDASLQDIFDQVAKHLLTQMSVSKLPREPHICAYRGDNGKKCAIGCLISDKEYMKEMEGKKVNDVFDLFYGINRNSNVLEKQYLLFALQMVHDMKEPVTWSAHLSTIAYEYKLSNNILKTFNK